MSRVRKTRPAALAPDLPVKGRKNTFTIRLSCEGIRNRREPGTLSRTWADLDGSKIHVVLFNREADNRKVVCRIAIAGNHNNHELVLGVPRRLSCAENVKCCHHITIIHDAEATTPTQLEFSWLDLPRFLYFHLRLYLAIPKDSDDRFSHRSNSRLYTFISRVIDRTLIPLTLLRLSPFPSPSRLPPARYGT
jgi:hypothetical protein